jgi:hypothetical protein
VLDFAILAEKQKSKSTLDVFIYKGLNAQVGKGQNCHYYWHEINKKHERNKSDQEPPSGLGCMNPIFNDFNEHELVQSIDDVVSCNVFQIHAPQVDVAI